MARLRSRAPMLVFESSAAIARSPEQVWAVLADVGAMKAWVPGLREARVVGQGPLRAGKVREVPVTIDAWEPPRRMVRTAATPAGMFTFTYTVEPAPGGALLKLRAEGRPEGLGQRLPFRLGKGVVAKENRDLPARLKAAVEGR